MNINNDCVIKLNSSKSSFCGFALIFGVTFGSSSIKDMPKNGIKMKNGGQFFFSKSIFGKSSLQNFIRRISRLSN